MESTELRFFTKPKLKKPIAVEGLPGIGLVGKLAADHLLHELKAKKFCELYSSHFPPQVIVKDDGTVTMLKNEFYYVKGKKNDIVLIVGDFQGLTPQSQYELSAKIINVLEGVGVSLVYTLGGLGTGKVVKNPRVFGAATDIKLIKDIKKHGVIINKKGGGGIFGASGLLLGIGQLRSMQGVCLMGETLGQVVDAKSAKNLLKVLTKILDIPVDMKELDKRAKKTEEDLRKIEKLQQEQVKSLEMAALNKKSAEEDITRYIR